MATSSSRVAPPPRSSSPRSNSSPPRTPSFNPRVPLTDSQRWHHLSTRTPSSTPFIYAVLTTKIYCLPTCPSRLARRANVIFFSDPKAASSAGFRACKRCKPDLSPSFVPVRNDNLQKTSNTDQLETANFFNSEETQFDPTDPSLKLHQAIALVKASSERGDKISLAQLAKEVGLSKWHLQRAFKRRVGSSPREMGEELLKKQREGMSGATAAGLGETEEDRSMNSPREGDGYGSLRRSNRVAGNLAGQEDMVNIDDAQLLAVPIDPFLQLPADTTVPYPSSTYLPALMDTSTFPPLDSDPWNTSSEIAWKLSNDYLTDSASSSVPSSIATPLPSNMDLDDAWNFYPNGFNSDVEGVLRDLFPEIYDENVPGEGQSMMIK